MVHKQPKRRRGHSAPNKAAKSRDLLPQFRAACRCWESGDYQRAVVLFREVIALEHGDPFFSRYWLASCLFQSGSFDELDRLLLKHDEHSGIWRFAQALEAFRMHGDTEDSQRLLIEADHLEPGFQDYLLRDSVVDASRQVRFGAGGAEQAFGCARLFLPAWRAVPGATTWARRVLKVPPTGVDEDNVARRFPRDELRSLPLRRDTWQVGVLPHAGAENKPMWLLGVANIDGQEMRAITVVDRPLTETIAWNEMIPSFLKPMEGDPARPSTLVVSRPEFCDAWEPLLSDIGIRCRHEKDPIVCQLLDAMGREIKKRDLPPAEGIDIREFPQSDATWQADFVRSPAWVMNEEDGSHRPWLAVVLDKSQGIALTTSQMAGDPTPEMLLEYLVRTIARPDGNSTERPRLVEVSDSDCYDYMRPRLEAAGVACHLVDEVTELNNFCLDLAKSFDGPEKCSLADGKLVTRAQMESFYEAAAYYFRQAPWNHVPGELPIAIRCSDPPMGTRFAIVLGRTGVQLGLCIFDDWEMTRKMLAGRVRPDEHRALSVCYDEAEIMSAVDLQLIERLGWPIATPEAWPAVMRLQPRRTPCSASAEELVFLDACLRAVPDFIKAKVASNSMRVETGTHPVELHLAWG
jgi:hypothetical protein